MYVYNPYNFNVNSATKLTTGRTIWGQSFDGSDNVDGTLSIYGGTGYYNHAIRIHKSPNGWTTLMFCGADNTDNGDTSVNSWGIHNDNHNDFIIYRNSSDASNGLIITKSGNVGIGELNPTYKLDIVGDVYINGAIQVETPISI